MATSKTKDSVESGLSDYELRWNDHIPYFTTVFQSLRDLNELTDVTFACEDGIVGAHKLVLSSCSVYLRILFARLGTPHPVIFLKNTPVSLVRHVLEFIYCGSVNVSKEELALVLSLGHSLQIHGLTKLKLSGDNDSSGDKRVYELEKERERLEEQLASEKQNLPGEIRNSPTYSLHHGKKMEFVNENNNEIIKEKINKKPLGRPPKASSLVIQEKKVEENKIIKETQKPKIKTSKATKIKVSTRFTKTKERTCKAKNEKVTKTNKNIVAKPKKSNQEKTTKVKQAKGSVNCSKIGNQEKTIGFKQAKGSANCGKTEKQEKTKMKQGKGSVICAKTTTTKNSNKIEKVSKLKPQKCFHPTKGTYYRYDPLLKKRIGKYYVEHGFNEVKKYFKKKYGFEAHSSTLYQMRIAYLTSIRRE